MDYGIDSFSYSLILSLIDMRLSIYIVKYKAIAKAIYINIVNI